MNGDDSGTGGGEGDADRDGEAKVVDEGGWVRDAKVDD